jgi:hypothetical protein
MTKFEVIGLFLGGEWRFPCCRLARQTHQLRPGINAGSSQPRMCTPGWSPSVGPSPNALPPSLDGDMLCFLLLLGIFWSHFRWMDVGSKNSAHQTESSSSDRSSEDWRSVWNIYVRIGDCAQSTSSRWSMSSTVAQIRH